jgi:hypothetical protein
MNGLNDEKRIALFFTELQTLETIIKVKEQKKLVKSIFKYI